CSTATSSRRWAATTGARSPARWTRCARAAVSVAIATAATTSAASRRASPASSASSTTIPTQGRERGPERPPASLHLAPEQPLGVAGGDPLRLVGRQLREPAAIALHQPVIGEPALVDPGVGADQEAIGVFGEQRAPVGGELARAVGDAAAIRELTPQRVF